MRFPPLLGWSHYLVLLRIKNDAARSFYEIEAAREGWSVRELERQIGALLFERLAASRDTEGVRALARRGQDVAVAGDVIKDPFVLEFLDLREIPTARDADDCPDSVWTMSEPSPTDDLPDGVWRMSRYAR